MSIDKRAVQRQFNNSAACYNGLAAMQREIVERLLARRPTLNSADNAIIADIGCGTGFGLLRLNQCYQNVNLVGLDLAPAMLRIADTLPVSELKLIVGDIEALPFSGQSIDLCFSSSAIQWCDAPLAIMQMTECLKPGGRAMISSFLEGTLDRWRALWGGENDQTFLSCEQFEAAFYQAGLELENLWVESYVQSFTSFEAALESIRGLGAGNASTSRSKGLFGPGRLRSIIDAVNKEIERTGTYDLNYEVVYAVASKPCGYHEAH